MRPVRLSYSKMVRRSDGTSDRAEVTYEIDREDDAAAVMAEAQRFVRNSLTDEPVRKRPAPLNPSPNGVPARGGSNPPGDQL
jgi:hypothetical protein